MEIYKIKSFILILIVYLVSLLPSIILLSSKKACSSKKNFVQILSICTIIEVIVFSLIYAFPRNLIHMLKLPINIENYSIYSLKILFMGSIFTPIHYGLPMYLFRTEKKKKAFILFSLKILYIPILTIINFAFSTQTALFTMPVLDLLYSIFLGIMLYKV